MLLGKPKSCVCCRKVSFRLSTSSNLTYKKKNGTNIKEKKETKEKKEKNRKKTKVHSYFVGDGRTTIAFVLVKTGTFAGFV